MGKNNKYASNENNSINPELRNHVTKAVNKNSEKKKKVLDGLSKRSYQPPTVISNRLKDRYNGPGVKK
ncbi:hypothetical protein COZ22_01515 [bacterium (Candidatus Howlettbacteria) CG_4_10_14_3_um_filter_37_10]|uniref:Uncharacterized protein n=1 Tax=candidate division WWE3 bacterium CG10_big_fil_rev_8_21_14_0_10_32_10 TaxID=1975090 RepID=A0A2H0RBW9_UNCKA|nr:MAG: hypothetical protein COV24_03600 [candidate division WWE3 bacterium CG10_big_fil_rev_8_21_14_0_10_32_10]PIX99923.1 MAG: hypothetical protein COZ22_01515 [bacterium (Candidatus Howlettbacteria) CG_4_10_14_3_um_filter_37_10]